MPSITSSLNYGISQQQQNRLAAAQQHLQHRQTDEVGAAVVSLARVAALLQQREPELYAQLLESDAAGRAGGAINSSARGGAGGDHGGSRRSGAAQEDEAFRQGKTPCLCPRSSPPPGFERRVPAVDSSAGTACTRVHPRGEDSGQGLFGASGSVSWRRAALQPADERALTAASGGGAASLDSSYSPPHGRSLAASKTPTESASGATFFRGAAVAGGPPPGADRFRVVQQKRVERIAAGPGTTTVSLMKCRIPQPKPRLSSSVIFRRRAVTPLTVPMLVGGASSHPC